jgi:hypothetical protein
MFGGDDVILRLLLGLGVGAAVMTALFTWLAARRYGRRLAVLVPVLAVLAVGFVLWRARALGPGEALGFASYAAALIGPAVAGGLLGLVLSGRGTRG